MSMLLALCAETSEQLAINLQLIPLLSFLLLLFSHCLSTAAVSVRHSSAVCIPSVLSIHVAPFGLGDGDGGGEEEGGQTDLTTVIKST